MAKSRAPFVGALLATCVGAAPVLAATEVTTCDQAYRGTAYLAADLDCTGSGLGHLVFNGRGRLLLRGHTLTGGVICTICTVIGPGTVTGNSSASAGVRGTIKATVVDVTISGNGHGVVAHTFEKKGKVVVRDSIITGNQFHGVDADRGAKVRDSIITGNGLNGINVSCDGRSKVVVRDATVSGNGMDPVCGDAVTCADLATCGAPPALVGAVSCETSYVLGSGVPGDDFGICSLD